MNLVGNLEDLGLAEIMQIVSLSRKSGILTLTSIRGEGKIVFSQGEVVLATSPDYRETIAELLVQNGACDQATLERALSLQEREGSRERIGTILASRFSTPAETIEKVIREQIERVVGSLFRWTVGTFDFELHEHVDMVDTLETEEMQFMLEKGISSQYLAIDGLRRLDEERHGGADTETDITLPTETAPVNKSPEPLPIFHAEELSPSAEPSPEPDKRHVILLVDDHGATREILAASLEECGYEVYPFAGGADSPLMRLASLQREGVRPLLLIDLIMPKMDGTGFMGGIEILELIRSNFPEVPVLAMADINNAEAEQELRRMGHPLIMKPDEEEIVDPESVNDFMVALLTGLNRIRSGGEAPETCENVNLGDVLRRELGEAPAYTLPQVVQSTGIALLRGMLEELNDPALEGGITLLVLRFAAEFMNRGVIFVVKRDKIEGLGQFGISSKSGSADSIVRRMKIPKSEDSLFARVLESRISLKASPDDGEWTGYVLENLGGEAPAEIFLGPIVSEEKVVAMLYGDNLPEKKPIGDTDSLEIFLSQAGVAMEKAILKRKLKGMGREVT